MSVITLPPSFPIIGLPLAAAISLQVYQIMTVSRARKEAGVKYPTLYVSEAEANADPKKMRFNCAQRAHGNTLENIPYILALFGFLSIFHPLLSSALFTHWIIARFSYTAGYASGIPSNRTGLLYSTSYLSFLGLLVGTVYVATTKAIEIYL